MTGEYADIVEVQEPSIRDVNAFLAHGWRLLTVEAVAKSAAHDRSSADEPLPRMTYYVRRSLHYVVGRTADIAPWYPWAPGPVATEGDR